jgi:hypothetical protein
MDVSALDRATGRIAVQLRLDEITQALRGFALDNDGIASYRALELTLRDHLEMLGDEGCGNGEKEREGCCIEGATASDYIHKRAE